MKLDELIAQQAYLLDTLLAYRSILKSGDCNICGHTNICQYEPAPGQLVRYNCPHYQKREGET